MPFQIIQQDITKVRADAIVNAANPNLKAGSGVCGAIFEAAGAEKLQAACDRLGGCTVGDAVLTEGYGLPCHFIIHTVGPIWQGGNADEREKLASCYSRSLELAKARGLHSVAFPLIASGVYGFPKDLALQTAISVIGAFLLRHDMEVTLVIFDREACTLSEKLFSSIQKFIDEHYVADYKYTRPRRILQEYELQEYESEESKLLTPDVSDLKETDSLTWNQEPLMEEFAAASAAPIGRAEESEAPRGLDEAVSHLDESFSQALLRLIDQKGRTDVETYKRANIDRKLFSKIRKGQNYNPSKSTALALAIALELSLVETQSLLATAGYTLSRSYKSDVIILYFIQQNNYDIFQINEALFVFGQPLLGAS